MCAVCSLKQQQKQIMCTASFRGQHRHQIQCILEDKLNIACLGIQYIHGVQSVSMLLANSFQFTSDSVRREYLKNLKNAVDLGRVIA